MQKNKKAWAWKEEWYGDIWVAELKCRERNVL